MRHRVYGRKLSRNKDQRIALFKSLVRALVISEKIETTISKAKAIKGLVDRLVNQAKSPTTARLVRQFLTEKNIQEKLILDIAPRMSDRTSGYTSIMRVGKRAGDGTTVVRMSFVDGIDKKAVAIQEPEEVVKLEKSSDVKEEIKQVKVKKGVVRTKAKSKK